MVDIHLENKDLVMAIAHAWLHNFEKQFQGTRELPISRGKQTYGL